MNDEDKPINKEHAKKIIENYLHETNAPQRVIYSLCFYDDEWLKENYRISTIVQQQRRK